MSEAPHEVQLALADFDRSQLPPEARDLQGDAFREAVRGHLAEEFIASQGAAEVVVTENRIIIRWADSAKKKSLTDVGIDFLKQGDYDRGIGLLRQALQRDADDDDALYNLGMALSDGGELDEAAELLRRLVTLDPSHARGWVALGVAHVRCKRPAEALQALRKAVELSPNDAYARMNLGATLSQTGELEEAIRHLRKATELLPGNPQPWFNLAMTHEELGEYRDADEAYQKVLALDRAGGLGERAEKGRSRIAERNFRQAGGGFRGDAVAYCLSALRRFEKMPLAEVQKISFEIAMLGTRGLDVNDPAEKYTLNSIPGKFSGLHLLCIEYVGFQKIDPAVDLGFDLSAEHAEAKAMMDS
jgi:Flp pilus assembly protein TadD